MGHRRIESFLLRVVIEERANHSSIEWRGKIQHIGSGIERQFDTLPDLLAFIEAQFSMDIDALPLHKSHSSECDLPPTA